MSSLTTFFGEVNELNSRAIYWSDNESDDESAANETTDITSGSNVLLTLNDTLNPKTNIVYVSLAKSDKTVVKELSQLGSVAIDGATGKVADIYATDKTSIWIQLYANHHNLKSHLLVTTIASIMRQTLSKLDASIEPLVCIVCKELSKDSSSEDAITYLTTRDTNLTIIPQQLTRRPLLAPKMIDNLVESSVFEYCIVFGHSCIALIFPELQSKAFISRFIPKPITDSVHQFNQLFDNNIYL